MGAISWYLAAAVLVLYLPMELWFHSWRQTVDYPSQPDELRVMTVVYWLLVLSLAVSVVW